MSRAIVVGIAGMTFTLLGTTAAWGQASAEKTDATSESTITYRSAVATDHLALTAAAGPQTEPCNTLTTRYAWAVAMERWAAAESGARCSE